MRWFAAITGFVLVVVCVVAVLVKERPSARKMGYRANIRTFHYGCKRYLSEYARMKCKGTCYIRFVVHHPKVWKQPRKMECKL